MPMRLYVISPLKKWTFKASYFGYYYKINLLLKRAQYYNEHHFYTTGFFHNMLPFGFMAY